MVRPRIHRRIKFNPEVTYFKPRGIPLTNLKEVTLEKDEMQAIKLYEVDRIDQTESARKMGVSQPTFARILGRGIGKICDAIVNGKAIKIE